MIRVLYIFLLLVIFFLFGNNTTQMQHTSKKHKSIVFIDDIDAKSRVSCSKCKLQEIKNIPLKLNHSRQEKTQSPQTYKYIGISSQYISLCNSLILHEADVSPPLV